MTAKATIIRLMLNAKNLANWLSGQTSRVIDENTVEVRANNPAPDFIPMLAADAFKIMSKAWDESDVDTSRWENGMGSGPFVPTNLAKDVSMELERNPNYWKEGLPYLDGIIHYYIADKDTAIGSYRTGQVLMTTFPVTNLSNTEILQLQEAEADILDVYLIPNTSLLGTLINTTIEPFNDVRVRRAMHPGGRSYRVPHHFGGRDRSGGNAVPSRYLVRTDDGRSIAATRIP